MKESPESKQDLTKLENMPELMNIWPQTGSVLGIGRNASFRAVARGDIPTIRLGKRILVPRRQLERLLNGAV